MGDIVKPVAVWISENIPWTILIILFFLSLLFEISKVKVYPLKWLWKMISWPFKKIDEQRTSSFKGIVNELKTELDTKFTDMVKSQSANCIEVKSCFVELEKRFDKLDARQNETEERLDELAAARIKNHVLNFARQCRKGEPHSKEDYRNLFEECKIYEALIEKYQNMDEAHKKRWENNVFVHDFAYIEKMYDECNMKNSFLGD